MGSELFLFLYTLYHAGNAHLAIAGMPVMGPGRMQMRSVVDGIELGCAFNLPVSPVSLPPVREAGSYRLPALKQGKAELRSSFLVSIGSFGESASVLSPIVRLLLVSYWKHTKYSCGGSSIMEGIEVIGRVANDAFKGPCEGC